MRFFLFIAMLVISYTAFSQRRHQPAVTEDSLIRKWIRSVVNLEVRMPKYENWLKERFGEMSDSARESLSPQQMKKLYETDSRLDSLYTSSTGTSIFLKWKNRRYLITAKHVVCDSLGGISHKIYFVPQQKDIRDTLIDKKAPMLFLLTELQYSSSEKEDITIISLNIQGDCIRFGEYLERNYHPIHLSDIDTVCKLKYGQDLMCIGFPFFSKWKTRDLAYAKNFRSPYLFEPAVSFGKISVPFRSNFVADINVAPGNSGGPVISGNKLVGIVSAQPIYSVEDGLGRTVQNNYYRMWYAIVINSSQILPVLRNLIETENRVLTEFPGVQHVN